MFPRESRHSTSSIAALRTACAVCSWPGVPGDATPNPHFCCLAGNFPVEEDIGCWFSGGRAAVEWWASWTEQGQELTYAGVTVLYFDDQGQVVEHRDYDNHVEQRQPPYADW
jgi:YD repeat-containing protein